MAVSLLVMATACGTRVDESSASRNRTRRTSSQPAGDQTVDQGTASDGSATAGDQGGTGTAQNAGGATGTGTGSGGTGGTGATGSGSGGTGGSASSAGRGSASTVVVGAVGTRSGVVGASGEGHWKSLVAWSQWVNTRGGVSGHPVKLVTIDDGGDPGRHAAGVRRLIETDKVVAFVGSWAPISFSAGVPILEQNHIPAMGGDAAEKGWFVSPFAFPFNGGPKPEGIAQARFALSLPAKRLAIFYLGEVALGKAIADYVLPRWRAAGRQVVVESTISLAQPDFTAEVLRAKSANADIVLLETEQTGCRRFLEASARQNYAPTFLSDVACADPLVASVLHGRTYYASTRLEPVSSDVPGWNEMRLALARFAPDVPHPIPFQTNSGWASGKLFEAAVAAVGGRVDTKSIVDGLHALKSETLGGMLAPIDWPAGPHPERSCAKIVRFADGDWRSVTPEFLC